MHNQITQIINRNPKNILLAIFFGTLFWISISTLFGVTAFLDWRRHESSYDVAIFISTYASGFGAWIFCSPLIYFSSSYIGARPGNFLSKIAPTLLLCVTVIVLMATYVFATIPLLFGSRAGAAAAATPYLEWGWDIFIAVTIFLAGVSRGHATRLAAQALENGRLRNTIVESQRDIAEFELTQLRHQFSSHFLLNAMSNIIGLIRAGRNVDAEKAAELLSKILKRISGSPNSEFIDVQNEIEATKEYLEFQKIRYPKFYSSVDIIGNANLATIPRDLLQPLVENAFKHGMNSDGCLGFKILLERRENWLSICIENSRPISTEGMQGNDYRLFSLNGEYAGQGLDIVKKRLQSLFGTNHAIRLYLSDKRFKIEIDIPWQT